MASEAERSSATRPKLAELAARYVWWQPVEATLREPLPLLWSVLKIGTAEDYVALRELVGEAALIDALRRAPPGAIDERSWVFWHRHFGLPEAPLPTRRFA
jgi:hypothetical protein